MGTLNESSVELEENLRAKHSTLSTVDVRTSNLLNRREIQDLLLFKLRNAIHCFLLSANSNFVAPVTIRHRESSVSIRRINPLQSEEVIPVGYSDRACR